MYQAIPSDVVLGNPDHDTPTPIFLIGDTPRESVWNISVNLTDRWGEINLHMAAQKPLAGLVNDPDLLERLRGQMWDELSFIVRKDGRYGVLFEGEYCSQESEEVFYKNRTKDQWFLNLKKTSQENVEFLVKALVKLQDRFPGVEFCVAHNSNMVEGRDGIWAFVPDGVLDDEQRQALGMAILEL